jgi:hypothetical protein
MRSTAADLIEEQKTQKLPSSMAALPMPTFPLGRIGSLPYGSESAVAVT